MKRTVCLLLCLIFLALPCISAQADSSLTVILTNKGSNLYINSYNALLSRMKPNGYTPTSSSGNYEGMYLRDAASEAIALTANGSFNQAYKLLNYIYEYHTVTEADHLFTRIGEITSEYTQNNFSDTITTGEAFENFAQEKHDKVVAELGKDCYFACNFTATSEYIKALKLYLTGSFTRMDISLAQISNEKDNFNILFTYTDHTPFEGNDWRYFEFIQEFGLNLGEQYYLIFSAEVPEKKTLKIKGTIDTCENYYYNPALYGKSWQLTSDSAAIKTYRDGFTSDSYSTNILDFSHQIGSQNKVIQQVASYDEQICEVIVNIEKASAEITSPLVASLYADEDCTELIDQTVIDAKDIPTYAKYIIIPFNYVHSYIPEYYYLCLTSDSQTYSGYYWYGTTSFPGLDSLAFYSNVMTQMDGEFSYFTARMKLPELSTGTEKQSDTAFLFLHAFAQWYLKNPDTETKTAFANKVWDKFSSYAKVFLNGNYFSKNLNLIYNPQLRHINTSYSGYDLFTNVFASQALKELSDVAAELNKTNDCELFKKYSELINKGIEENLTVTYNGKKIYAELRKGADDSTVRTGFSYINLSPSAANWYAVDNTVLKNTYEAYLNVATVSVGDYLITDANYNLESRTPSNIVMGQNVAFELLTSLRFGNSSRAKHLLEFLDKYNENVYPERWGISGNAYDIGNQSQCGWLIYALVTMFPALAQNPVENESQNGIGVDISGDGNNNTVVTVVDNWPLSKIIVVGIMCVTAIILVASTLLLIISRRTGVKAYARAIAAKRYRERISNESFNISINTEDSSEKIEGFSIKEDLD